MSRIWALVFFVIITGCGDFAAQTSRTEVVKSPNDTQQYRYLELENGLKALLVEDMTAEKAAASLDVSVGSAQDPRDRQGLAHFLEHMLFLGTDKHQDPGEYQAFISEHGGSYNAYTAFLNTNYFFDIEPAHFDAALDRFSRFFVAPLFNADYVEREKNAVHSEYQARIKNDFRRQYDVFQQVVNPAHPASTFSVGSLETLADRPGAPVRQALLDFYHTHYSADRMALVVVAPQPLDVLEAKVRTLFAPVPKRDSLEVDIDAPMFAPGSLPKVVYIEPIREMRELSLIFPVIDDQPFYREKPLAYLGNLLGHEGQGSLLALLKEKGYAEGLSAGAAMHDGSESAFQVSIDLTVDGLRHWQEVVALVFDQIALIREHGVEAWRHREQARLADIHFRFLEKVSPISYASQLAVQMQDYPVEDVLRGPYRMDAYNAERIHRELAKLKVENVLISITAPEVETDRASPFYQTSYAVREPTEEELQQWRSQERDSALQLPPVNPYIPENFALLPTATAAKPILLEPGLWHVPDRQFGVPKVQLKAAFKSPQVNKVETTALTALLLSVVEENLSAESYPAALAGLSYSFAMNPDGFGFSLGGFGDKIPVLLDKIVQRVRSPKLDQAVVTRVRNELIRKWRNSVKSEPYRQVWAEVPIILEATRYDPLTLADALENVTLQTLEDFALTLFEASDLTFLIGGNISEKQALKLFAKVANLLDDTAPAKVARGVGRLEGRQTQKIIIDHDDTALIRYYQGSSDSLEEMARFMVLRQLIKAPFFNDLRTEQQLGYVVAAVDLTMDRMPGIGLLVQSPVADQAAIEKAIGDFLDAFAQNLANMTEAELQTYRNGVIANLREPPKSLAERVARDWTAIDLGYLDFTMREQLIAAVENYSLEEARADFVDIFQRGTWLQVVSARNASEDVGARDGSTTVNNG